MSRYLVYQEIKFKNKQLLLDALAELGWDQTKVEEGNNLHLYGYHGDKRAETADIVIRRQYIGSSSNDLGFTWDGDGYVPIISEYDKGSLKGGRFLPLLKGAYNKEVAHEVSRRLRGVTTEYADAKGMNISVRFGL